MKSKRQEAGGGASRPLFLMTDTPKKRCSRCERFYPATTQFFYRHKLSKDGLRPDCKACCAMQDKMRGQKPAKIVDRDNEKLCARCNLWKSLAEFAANSKTRSGRQSWCKSCYQEYLTSPGVKEKQYLYDTSERRRNSIVRRRNDNPELFRMRARRYRARVHSLPLSFTLQDWEYALSYFKGRCAVCGRPRGLWHTLAADHWIPLSDSRPDNPGTVPWNILPLCHGERGCNNIKGSKEPIQWLTDTFGKRRAKKILAAINTYFETIKGR